MKILPDNPNLDHLRRQAKGLLAGLRDSDPTVTLTDAQAALSQQYGFRSWVELKAEVDRRQGGADVADDALGRAIAAQYALGTVSGPMTSMARPDDSVRRWRLDTDEGRWEVRTMDTWHPIVDADTDVALQEAAAAAGVSLPMPVRSVDGRVIEEIGGHSWRVHRRLPAGPPLSAPVSAQTTRRVGEVLATIHGLALPVDRVSPYHSMRLFSTPWTEFVTRAKVRGAPWAPALDAAVPTLRELEDVGAGAAEPEPVLSHNNLTPGNVRLAADGRMIVQAWEHAGGQPPAWELCGALMQWAVEPGGGVNVAGAQAMAAGYRAVAGGLPPLELAAFRGAVVSLENYVCGLFEEALGADDPDDEAFFARSVQHMLTQLPTRATLEQLVQAIVPVR